METYEVRIKQIGYAYVIIDAKDADEAVEKVKDKAMNGDGDTIPDDFGWQINYDAEEYAKA